MWWLVQPAVAADFAAMHRLDGWEVVAQPTTRETGTVDLRLKTIAGTRCLRGAATVDVPADTLYAVVTDIPAAKRFSSETLLAAEELGRHDGALDYYEHLDVPGWTMAADRFWVLRGNDASTSGLRRFQWDRFDWRTRYPALAARIDRDHPDAVEPKPNFGSWTFTPGPGGTEAVYVLCSNPGGSLPEWLQRTAATKTLPGTMADVIREGRRRVSP